MSDTLPDAEAIPLTLGVRLRLVREQNGFSQRELAKRASVTHSSISMIEQGLNSPSISSLEKILSGIPMSLAHFFACDPHCVAPIITRSSSLIVKQINAGVSVQNIPHLSAGTGLQLQKMILAVGAETALLSPRNALSGFIVCGQLELSVNAHVFVVNVGDVFTLSLVQTYSLRNSSLEEDCILLMCDA